MRGILGNTQLQNIIKGLKINLKHKLLSQLNTLHLGLKQETELSWLMQIICYKLEYRKRADKMLLKTL